jgi:hypothetical protein
VLCQKTQESRDSRRPRRSGTRAFRLRNEYSTFYAEADDGAFWAGPYAVNVPLHAFDDWCWDLGVQPGLDIGMALVSATNAWFPWVGTINLT